MTRMKNHTVELVFNCYIIIMKEKFKLINFLRGFAR